METLKDICKNRDGFVDQDENIVDVSSEDSCPESDGVLSKYEGFNNFQNLNKHRSRTRVRFSIRSSNYDHLGQGQALGA